jgi:outer membrane protein insertion porin family
VVDLYFNVTENNEIYVGNIYVEGNTYTQDKVIRRELSFYPGEKFNLGEMEASRTRLQRLGGYESQYFTEVGIEIAPKKDERIENGRRVRDVYVKVVENESFGRIRFGAAISTNEGLMGDITLIRSNFDIADLPTSFKDMFVDRTAFLGAGQYFSISAQPGLQFSRFSVNFAEPYLFGTPTSMGLSLFMWDRQRESFNEGRSGFNMGLGRRLPDNYSIDMNLRLENVNIKSVDDSAPQDVKDVQGTNSLYGVRFTLSKDTLLIDRFFKPYGGYRSYASIEPVFGDFSLMKWVFGSTRYRTIYENEAGEKHIIKLEGEVGWITGNSRTAASARCRTATRSEAIRSCTGRRSIRSRFSATRCAG